MHATRTRLHRDEPGTSKYDMGLVHVHHLIARVQFSLIDTRPLDGMVHVCEKHDVKLLTYGTLVRLAGQTSGEKIADKYPHVTLIVWWIPR